MTASNPLIEKIITFTLGGVSYAEDAIDAWIETTPGEITAVTTLDGVVHQQVGTESYALHVNMVLDYDSGRPGLAYYCYTNAGTTGIALVFNPHSAGGETAAAPKFTGSVTIPAVNIGGKGNEYGEYEAVFPLSGKPVRDGTP